MSCKKCQVKVKDWKGEDANCAFNDREFDTDNWNCDTCNDIREICSDWNQEFPDGVQYRYCDDQKYATMDINEIELDDECIGMTLWVSWYKSRGRTEEMWILEVGRDPRRPTEKELLAIIDFYKKKQV